MHFLPSKKIIWLVVGIIAVEGLFVFSHKNDGLFPKREAPKPEVAAEESGSAVIFAQDPNTSEKVVAEVAPTDNVLNYLSQIGRSLAEGAQQISIPEPSYEPPAPRFSERNLSTTPTTRKNAETYVVQTILVLAAYPSFRDSDPLSTIEAWLETEDPEKANEIRAQAHAYRKTAEALARVSVPTAYVAPHLNLMNTIDRGGDALLAVLETIQGNPGTGLIAAAHYTSALERIEGGVVSLLGLLQ